MEINFRDIRYGYGELGGELLHPGDGRDWEDTLKDTNPKVYKLLEDAMEDAASDAAHGDRLSMVFAQEMIAMKDLLTPIFGPIYSALGQRFPKLSEKTFCDAWTSYGGHSFGELIRLLDEICFGWGKHFETTWLCYTPSGHLDTTEWSIASLAERVVLATGIALIAEIGSVDTKTLAEELASTPEFIEEQECRRFSLGVANDPELEEEYAAHTSGALAFSRFRIPKRRMASLGEGTGKVLQFRPRSQ